MPPHRDQEITPLWVVAGLAMGPVVALGLARFAYALLLPAMRDDLGWNFADAGSMNAANAAGYLAGALVAAPAGRQVGDKTLFAAAVPATALVIAATALSGSFTVLLALRFAAGFTGALIFISGAGLTAAAAAGGSPARAPTLFGIYFAGGGIGITASALAVPPTLAAAGWRAGWLVLGLVASLATVLAWLVLGRAPSPHLDPNAAMRGSGGWSLRFMIPKLVSYLLFGAGYIAYMTFVIAYLHGEGFSDGFVSVFWAALGLSTVAGAFAWGPLLGRLKGGWGATVTIGVVTLGAGLPLVCRGVAGAIVSAILFGGSFLAVVAAVTAFARRAARPHAWTAAIGALTVAFGLGQCIGPVLSGALSDGPAGVRAGLLLSVAILAAGAVVAIFQREPERAA